MLGNYLTEVIPAGWSYPLLFDTHIEPYLRVFLLLILDKYISPLSSQDYLSEQPVPSLKAACNPQIFRVEDTQDFFGRDRLIEKLLEKIEQQLTVDQQDKVASHLLTVLEPSGSGKSSVVMISLLTKLKQYGSIWITSRDIF